MPRVHRVSLVAVIATCAVLAGSASAAAQELAAPPIAPQLRADVIDARDYTAVQAGGGVQIPAGLYVRVDLIGAAGVSVAHGNGASGTSASGRIDLIGRFLLDPFQQARWGLSVGGGLSLLAREGDRVRPLLAVVADLERRRTTPGIAPAVQVGLGGGLRIGGALRWGTPRFR
jgi:hypothetical protein